MDENLGNIFVGQFADSRIPTFKEVRGRDYIKYGDDNMYPEYLTYLVNKSAKHNAIVNGKADYIFGKGYDNGSTIINRSNESLNDITRKCILDIEIFGGFKLEIIWNKAGKISELYHVGFSTIRKGKDEGFYYKENWKLENREEPILLPCFNPAEPFGRQIFEYNEYRTDLRYYPLPGYIGCNNFIETDIEISKYYLSAIRNGFMPSKLVEFISAPLTTEAQRDVEGRWGKKFAGAENAGKFIFATSPSKEKSINITDLSASDLDKHFIELNKTVQQEIFSGHRITSPMLFGIKTEGQLGGNAELNLAYSIFQNTYSEPKANNYDREINWLLSFSVFKSEYKLQPTDPIGLQFDVKDVVNSLPKAFVFKELGIPEEMWSLENIGADNRPTPTTPIAPNTTVAPGQETVMSNDNIKNLTAKQHQQLMRIIRQYGKGQLTELAAKALLRTGLGLNEDDINNLLGIKSPLALSFNNVRCPKCLNYFDYNKVPESGMGYVKCPDCGHVITQISLSQESTIAMFDSCGESKNDYEILKSKKVSFSSELECEADEEIYIQEAFKTDVSLTESKILELVKKDPLITAAVIATALKESEAFIESKLKNLEARGYLERSITKVGTDELIRRVQPSNIKLPPPQKTPVQISIKYSYEGPKDSRNRPFCARMMQLNRLYSRADIENISQRLGYSVFDRRGGFWMHKDGEVTPYCRHRWVSNIVTRKGGENVS